MRACLLMQYSWQTVQSKLDLSEASCVTGLPYRVDACAVVHSWLSWLDEFVTQFCQLLDCIAFVLANQQVDRVLGKIFFPQNGFHLTF